ncbi:MAG TPA: phasin family protein [Burkholderiaceae bacterium]
MYTTPEQFSAAAKTNFEAQIAALSALTNSAFNSVTKIVDLNLNTAKASFADSSAAVKQLLAAKDAQEFLSLTSAQTQPTAEKALAYGRSLAGITSAAQAEFSKAAEEQIAEGNRKVSEFIDAVTKNAPAGSEKAVAFVKTAIDNANAGYEQFSKNAKKAAETLQANVDSAVTQFAQTTAKTTSRAKK